MHTNVVQVGRNATLYLGDCIEMMKLIPDRSVHLILTDLPYGTTRSRWAIVIPFNVLWAEYRRVLTVTGTVISTASEPFTTDLVASNRQWHKYNLIWEKTKATGFQQCWLKPMKIHEDVVVFSRGTVGTVHSKTRMVYNPQGLRELANPTFTSGSGARKLGSLLQGRPFAKVKKTHENFPTSILRYPSVPNKIGRHPTEKPVALFEYLVRTYSNDGETILDNCMGSGTTGVACGNVGNRTFIGIEMDPHFHEIAKRRIASVLSENAAERGNDATSNATSKHVPRVAGGRRRSPIDLDRVKFRYRPFVAPTNTLHHSLVRRERAENESRGG